MAMITSTHDDPTVSYLRHDRRWFDLSIAAVLAVVMVNLHVSTAGPALSSLERGDRRGFYGLLAVLAVVLLASTLGRDDAARRWCRGCLGFGAAAGMAGLLLDVQDGPVATVQLVALFGLFLAATAAVRLIRHTDDGPATGPRSSD
ncbi:MAG: hypothetical protein QOG43_1169 [Actinomycetota bacterium]|nr:hypothetical protein [Actinomycetota bacterium]